MESAALITPERNCSRTFTKRKLCRPRGQVNPATELYTSCGFPHTGTYINGECETTSSAGFPHTGTYINGECENEKGSSACRQLLANRIKMFITFSQCS
ncbi:hypothetical protein QE152_g15705 [Popillia japonica]|uniref:Uncharacterized protein n=1 Tax=Popillia japonica TaxID=7064 RepID=A0AAW1L747_POPJA